MRVRCWMNSSNLDDYLHRRFETSRGVGFTMAIERLLTGSIRERVQDLMSTEDLIIESFKDIVKDELKAHIRNKIEEDPDLHAEIKEAVAYYFHQKARSVYAELKATRSEEHASDYDFYLMNFKVKLEKPSSASLRKNWVPCWTRLLN